MNLNQITLPAVDVGAAVAFYRAMGFTQIVSAPHYARFECPEGDATFSVILSKAFFLANDTAITDVTITRQIKSG